MNFYVNLKIKQEDFVRIIIEATTMEPLQENIDSIDVVLSDEIIAEINTVQAIF